MRPHRSPHHTVSGVPLVGGGGHPLPGEISLAQHGVLLLDELTAFRCAALKVPREPMESGRPLARVARQQVPPGTGPDLLAAAAAGTVREPFTFGLDLDGALDEHGRLALELADAREALEETPSPDLAGSASGRAARMTRYSAALALVDETSKRLDALSHEIVRRVIARRDAARAVS